MQSRIQLVLKYMHTHTHTHTHAHTQTHTRARAHKHTLCVCVKEIIQVTPLTNQIDTSSAPDPDALRPVHQSNNYVTLNAVAGPTAANNKFAKYSVIAGQLPPVRARRKVTK